MTDDISVVIPTFNRSDMLERILPSYLISGLVKEVVVVDDASSTEHRARLQSLAKLDARIRLVYNEQNIGCPASRNVGIDSVKGDLVLVSEDDLELGDQYVEILSSHMKLSNADIISGRRLWLRVGESREQILKRSMEVKKPVVDYRWLDHNTNALTQEDETTILLSSTMLVKREVFSKVRYDPRFGGPSMWREESDFQISAHKSGFRLVYCPHAVSFHQARQSASYGANQVKGDILYLSWLFRNNLLFLEKHQDYLKQQPYNIFFLRNPRWTSFAYLLKQLVWLLGTELQRWINSRKHQSYKWR
jgi:GT2 family glycosyltransferase